MSFWFPFVTRKVERTRLRRLLLYFRVFLSNLRHPTCYTRPRQIHYRNLPAHACVWLLGSLFPLARKTSVLRLWDNSEIFLPVIRSISIFVVHIFTITFSHTTCFYHFWPSRVPLSSSLFLDRFAVVLFVLTFVVSWFSHVNNYLTNYVDMQSFVLQIDTPNKQKGPRLQPQP